MKQQFLVDTADTFKTYVFENNRKVAPSSATLTVYQPRSSTKLIDAAAMTVAGDGQLSYSLTTTHNDVADENYKAVVSYVASGTTYSVTLYYDVVNSKLSIVITDDDVVKELPQLRNKMEAFHGTADSGSTTTIVDDELKRFEDDYFTGGLATNLNNNETREITDFVSSSGTVTTTAATATAAGHKYVIQRSFSREIRRAFEKLEDMLYRAGKRAHLILDPYDVREVHIHLAVAEVCKSMMTDDASLWWQLHQDYDKRAYAIFKSIEFKYDTSEDGYISGAEEKKRMKMTLGRG